MDGVDHIGSFKCSFSRSRCFVGCRLVGLLISMDGCAVNYVWGCAFCTACVLGWFWIRILCFNMNLFPVEKGFVLIRSKSTCSSIVWYVFLFQSFAQLVEITDTMIRFAGSFANSIYNVYKYIVFWSISDISLVFGSDIYHKILFFLSVFL